MLPIYDIREELTAALKRSRRIILTAPTGSGKSTQVPQMLADMGILDGGKVVILQPRRLATRLLAARVAEERNTRLGDEVGYQIRMESVCGPKTRIHFETEGILLRQMLSEPDLPSISAILFDEFHERHVYGDVTLAQALRLQQTTRPDLILIVMSATLDTRLLQPYMEPCDVIRSEGRAFPVEVEHIAKPLHPVHDTPWDAAAAAYETATRDGHNPGDTLIFMPGSYEIQRTINALRNCSAAKGALLLPLHGELPPRDQDAAVARYDQKKIVVATNVAETSLTIDGIRLVIDAGLARVARFDPWRGINTLLIEHVSHASADQRAGRAGRTAPGHAIRLWTDYEHAGRATHDLPEIKRVDPSDIILTLKALGVKESEDFNWLEAPEPRALERALTLLRDLGALDGDGAPTPVGLRMLSFPVHPRYARMLLAAAERGAVRPIALIAAIAQGRPILVRKAGKQAAEDRRDTLGDSGGSDLLLLMRAWNYARHHRFDLNQCRKLGIHAAAARQVGPLWESFLRIAERQGLPIESSPPDDEEIAKCVLTGFSDQVARRLDRGTLRCDLVHKRRGELARESIADEASLLVANEINEIGRGDGEVNVLLTQATAIQEEWLRELFPDDFSERTTVEWDAAGKRVIAHRDIVFRDLALSSQPLDPPPAEEAARLLARAVLAGDCPLKQWNRAVDQWIARVNFLAQACPDWELPSYGDAERELVIQQICHGAVSAKAVKDRPVLPAVKSLLSPAHIALVDQYMPERVVLSNGRKVKVQYAGTTEPYISARIQELFGVESLPALAAGRLPLVLHILAPSHRPVQITKDLPGFWRDHYPRVKQEMHRKYPKHEWR
ncbi:MAG: ATP-dependent helicase HrpB [Kiritimatiellae bacterium]|nr:ATP-dependent helicase HrpB [Kiritimatiellia bacterium]MDD4341540.1 ATP-dependent helicase HrpB [Kiritimatiellia bacterium]